MDLSGIYAGYMAAAGGQGMALFVFNSGVIAGADMGGVQFDGSYRTNDDGTFTGTVDVKIPAGVTVIQGVTAPPAGLQYQVPLSMPADFISQPYFELTTPLGRVNVRLQKLRDLP